MTDVWPCGLALLEARNQRTGALPLGSLSLGNREQFSQLPARLHGGLEIGS